MKRWLVVLLISFLVFTGCEVSTGIFVRNDCNYAVSVTWEHLNNNEVHDFSFELEPTETIVFRSHSFNPKTKVLLVQVEKVDGTFMYEYDEQAIEKIFLEVKSRENVTIILHEDRIGIEVF